MLGLETPPKSAAGEHPVPPEPQRPVPRSALGKRVAYLDDHELIVLLDSIDDERARARFRESIYISLIVWLILAGVALFGPKYLFHQGRIVTAVPEHKNDHELTFLDLPKDLSKLPLPKAPKAISAQTTTAQTAHPVPQPKLPPQPRPGAPGAQAARPLPATPQPQPSAAPPQTQSQPAKPQTQPQPVRPVTTASNAIPDAPRPSTPTRPNFSTPASSGESVRSAANASRGAGGDYGTNAPRGHAGPTTGVEIISDTQGVDFAPYIRRLLRLVQASWDPLVPEECDPPLYKHGTTLIRFTISKNGTVALMHLDGSTHDVAIDRAAWGGITGVGQFPPLPAEFHGEDLSLRIQFISDKRPYPDRDQ